MVLLRRNMRPGLLEKVTVVAILDLTKWLNKCVAIEGVNAGLNFIPEVHLYGTKEMCKKSIILIPLNLLNIIE